MNAHACSQEVDGEETDQKGPGPQDRGPQVHRSQVDPEEPRTQVGSEVDCTQVDGSEVDRTEVDGSEVDAPQVDGSQVDRTEVDAQEPGSEVDSTEEHRQKAEVRREEGVALRVDWPMHPEGGRMPPFLASGAMPGCYAPDRPSPMSSSALLSCRTRPRHLPSQE